MRTISALIVTLLMISPCSAGNLAEGTKNLDEETRATIMKEMAKMKRYETGGDPAQAGGVFRGNQISRGNSREGCNMEVGNASSGDEPSRGPKPRRVVTVVTGSIIQQCN